MDDSCGVPESMFGPVPETFLTRLGWLVMVAAMLELRLLDLLTELDQAPQDRHAGKPGTSLIKECRDKLRAYDPVYELRAGDVLDRAQKALENRHAVVHSLWPEPGVDTAYGWRPVRPRKRERLTEPHRSMTLTGSDLRGLVGSTAALVQEVNTLRDAASAARRS